MRLALLTPTRDRPEQVARYLNSIADTCEPEELEQVLVMFYVDTDDPQRTKVLDTIETVCRDRGIAKHVHLSERVVLSRGWNDLWEIALREYDDVELFMMGADDIVFETRGWLSRFQYEFRKTSDRIVIVGADDGIQPNPNGLGWSPGTRGGTEPAGSLTHACVSKLWTEILGYFVPPLFACAKNDTWITNIGRRIDRCVWLGDVMIRHLHYGKGLSVNDLTYREQKAQRGPSQTLYNDTFEDRVRDAEKLREFLV